MDNSLGQWAGQVPTTPALSYPQMGGGGGNGLSPTPRETIQGAQEAETIAVMELHKALSELEQRLSVVLSPIGPSGEGVAKNVDPPYSVLGRVLQNTNAIRLAVQRIAEITNRLHL